MAKKQQKLKERMVYARVSETTIELLAEWAEWDDRSVSHLVRTAIDQYLNRRQARLEQG